MYSSAWAHFHRKPNTEPNRTETEPNSRFFRFFGSVSVFVSVLFGVRFRLRFHFDTEPNTPKNRNVAKPLASQAFGLPQFLDSAQ